MLDDSADVRKVTRVHIYPLARDGSESKPLVRVRVVNASGGGGHAAQSVHIDRTRRRRPRVVLEDEDEEEVAVEAEGPAVGAPGFRDPTGMVEQAPLRAQPQDGRGSGALPTSPQAIAARLEQIHSEARDLDGPRARDVWVGAPLKGWGGRVNGVGLHG